MPLSRSHGLVAILLALALPALLGCEVPNPMAPADPIGEQPKWGEGFAVPTEAPASALGGGSGAAGGTAAGGAGIAPTPGIKPGDTGDWGGGDATFGKGVWVAMCARCHGQGGEGGAMPDGTAVAALTDAAWHAATSDRDMARTIAMGKDKMPGFMRELDRAKLSGVIAHIRTLKQ